MSRLASKHYDQSYFSWQNSIGEFGGWANNGLFARIFTLKIQFSILAVAAAGY